MAAQSQGFLLKMTSPCSSGGWQSPPVVQHNVEFSSPAPVECPMALLIKNEDEDLSVY
ncbi:hypothetical protein PVAP13_1KG294900 [Panicum virgatum]|uniref:Uncharacterized protein n=1 Tax=Panicum virgatum TaxID=38727 RepID=A0A8T0XI50_PANVG|nr:hypothetical protein PVAP13_1KG294900 [Panicum virgatum]KAG2658609.1 hypothetical protein PVAP13_1KG294900 [Panicum virgatum]